MPRKFWIQVGAIVVVGLAAFIAIIANVGNDDAAPQNAAGAPAGGDGSGAVNAAAGEPDPALADIDPALLADLAAFVAERQALLPAVDDRSSWVEVQLASVETSGDEVGFRYKVDLDSDNYYAAAVPRAIVPEFEVAQCSAFSCYRFTEAFVPSVCADAALASLLAHGAVAMVGYYDRNDKQLGRLPVTGDDCDRLAAR